MPHSMARFQTTNGDCVADFQQVTDMFVLIGVDDFEYIDGCHLVTTEPNSMQNGLERIAVIVIIHVNGDIAQDYSQPMSPGVDQIAHLVRIMNLLAFHWLLQNGTCTDIVTITILY